MPPATPSTSKGGALPEGVSSSRQEGGRKHKEPGWGERGWQTAPYAPQTALGATLASPPTWSAGLDCSTWDLSREQREPPGPWEPCPAHPRGGANASRGSM